MMKKVLLLGFVSTLFAFSSCRQCTECTRYPNAADSQKLCKKDYASDDMYTQAYRQLVAAGYRCE